MIEVTKKDIALLQYVMWLRKRSSALEDKAQKLYGRGTVASDRAADKADSAAEKLWNKADKAAKVVVLRMLASGL